MFDPKRDGIVRATELHGNMDHTIWENTALHGRVTATWLRGSLVFVGGKFVGKKGEGRFLKCKPVAFDSSALV